MASADDAIHFVLVNEGGIEPHAERDAGGATKGGISLRFMQGLPAAVVQGMGIDYPVTEDVIDALSDLQIHSLYLTQFWAKQPFWRISSQRLCNYIFDTSVNLGIGEGIKTAQRAYNSLSGGKTLVVDGILGAYTVMAINEAPEEGMVTALVNARIALYKTIARERPEDARDLNGWVARANRI